MSEFDNRPVTVWVGCHRVFVAWLDTVRGPLWMWSDVVDAAGGSGSRLEVGMLAILALCMTLAWPIMVVSLPLVLAATVVVLSFAWIVGALLGGVTWVRDRVR